MNYREFEETLCRLPSVDAVRVVGDGTRITEVHVLAAYDKSPKQIARDVQSLAMARFGMNVDRKAISVVQLAGEKSEAVGGDRPKIAAIRETPEGSKLNVTVTLEWQGEQVTGSAGGPAAASARMRLVGEATLRALEESVTGTPPLALDAIGAPAVGMRDVIIAIVVSTTSGGEELAAGCAMVNGDESEAAARAVLDSLNRRIPALLR